MTTPERFWAKVDKRGPEDCWEWLGGRNAGGYANVHISGRWYIAHRFSYEFLVGPIPAGLTLDHLCKNRACVNPAHLEPVTGIENTLRGEGFSGRNARKTHCEAGHPLSGDNLRIDAGRLRRCRACQRQRHREAKARARAGVGAP